MPKDHLNPAGLPKWSESFSQIVVSHGPGGRTLYISGQVAADEDGQIIGRGDLAQQARKAFQNLSTALASAGAHPDDVVRLGIYVVGYDPSQAGVIREAMREIFRDPRLPASTWLGVESLALEGLLIEVEATAIVEVKSES